MSATIIDGKAIAADLRARVAAQVPSFRVGTGRVPGLAVVLVGRIVVGSPGSSATS